MTRHRKLREDTAGMAGAVGGGLAHRDAREDAWEKLLTDAGLETQDARPLAGGSLTPTQAARLLEQLMQKPVTLGTFPPRMAAGFLLREVLEGGEVSREELLRKVERFSRERVAVLRPDGYLAWALNGNTQQKVAPVEWKDGAFRAGNFELGRFYSGKGGVFRAVDAQLQASDWRPLAEVYSDADVISRSLDGAQDAFVELYHALGQTLSRPMDSIAALGNLPAGVAALIESSPAYWERFKFMTEGEQIREVARLTTSVFATWGAASATTRSLKGLAVGAEATVPVLSLSAEGVLALERVAVPAERAAVVLSGGPGAAIILQRASTASKGGAPSQGPGQWGPAKESMSARARRYQEQITGHSADEAYWVGGVGQNSGGVKFDGFKDEVLLEAKGPGYANKFLDNLAPRVWFEKSGAQALVDQAQRQLAKAPHSTHIRWHIAEQKTAEAIRELFRANQIEGIEIVFTPPLP
ncbi:Tox-REase-5 domain-containing protein [Corallococcus sp. AS-1-12]|uniref:Tox-REase-5 domain-containing protein n=1 Tax=Corallococcus sp. AS-1-12 TaxID=2874598 RepID=UPI001CC12712|nr:Tox-REase-5 domain-containing protein [Corallococcus sp. AS-1-12]